jgi:type VI secretion system secreted protein VgrG
LRIPRIGLRIPRIGLRIPRIGLRIPRIGLRITEYSDMHAFQAQEKPAVYATSRGGMRAAIIVPIIMLLAGATPALAEVALGTAANFAVLGGSAVTNTGPTDITGSLGVWSGSSITGAGSIVGASLASGPVSEQAQSDTTAALTIISGLTPTTSLTGLDLGTVGVLTPGVYTFSSSAGLTGNLVLNFASDPTGTVVFEIDSTLTTASDSTVIMENAAPTAEVIWDVGSSATLGTGTAMVGTIIANQSITLNTGASITCGRAIAQVGAVTMESNSISTACSATNGAGVPIPEPGSMLLLAASLAGMAVVRWASLRRS